MKETIPKLPYTGSEERYNKWEKEPIKVVNAIETVAKEKGFKLPKPLQQIKGSELTPNEAVDIDDKPLLDPNCPNIVFGRPHAGEYIPKDLYSRSTDEAKKSLAMVDRGTDIVFKSENIPSVGTKISRLVVDPNRAPLLEAEIENPAVLGKVLWYQGGFGEDMYEEGKEPTIEEVKEIVERFYLPYYNAMMGTIGSLADRRKNEDERILVLDGHSFPTSKDLQYVWNRYKIEKPEEMSLFIVGDREGESCDEDIREAFVEALENNFEELSDEEREKVLKNSKCKKIVGVNEYLKGVHNVQFYGQRKEGVNALQLELNENLYVDENGSYYDASYDEENLEIIKRLVEKTCLDIDPILKNKS